MKILLVYTDLCFGGVQTSIVQFTNQLLAAGHDVTLAIYEKGQLTHLLSERAKLVILPKPPRCFKPGVFSGHNFPLLEEVFDAVCSFDPASMWLAALYYRELECSAEFRTGVYHPRIYFYDPGFSLHEVLYRRLFNRYVSDNCKFFMNEECRLSHEKYFQRAMKDSDILPAPISSDPFHCTVRQPERFRIVSIGRLTSFKTYNIYMLDVVKELLDKGFDVTWDVYGDGEYESEMRRQIYRLDLARHVSLKGAVPFEDMSSVLASAYVFVGMGLSLIHAGALGIPCVPAIADREALSYGYLYDLPPFAVGEVLHEEPDRKIADLLCALLQMDQEGYEAECWKTREYCRQYKIERIGSLFLEQLKTKRNGAVALRDAPSIMFWLLYVLEIIRVAKSGVESKFFRFLHLILPGKLALALRNWRRCHIGRRASLRSHSKHRIRGLS